MEINIKINSYGELVSFEEMLKKGNYKTDGGYVYYKANTEQTINYFITSTRYLRATVDTKTMRYSVCGYYYNDNGNVCDYYSYKTKKKQIEILLIRPSYNSRIIKR